MNWLAWSLLSAAFAGITAVLAKVGVSQIDSTLATAIRTSVVLVFAWIVAAISRTGTTTWSIPRQAWVMLALSGVATGLSWLCYFRALQLGQASQVASIDKLSVVFVLVFAALWLGESVTPRTVTGVVLVVSGSIVLAIK